MSILGLIISISLFLIAIVVVARPILRPRDITERDDLQMQRQRDRVQVYYERVLTNIRDLDEDHATGKIDEADYRDEREVWVHRGIRLLRVGDGLDARQSLVTGRDADADTIDEAIEAAISAYRQGAGAAIHDPSPREAN